MKKNIFILHARSLSPPQFFTKNVLCCKMFTLLKISNSSNWIFILLYRIYVIIEKFIFLHLSIYVTYSFKFVQFLLYWNNLPNKIEFLRLFLHKIWIVLLTLKYLVTMLRSRWIVKKFLMIKHVEEVFE